jgi:hypothetical protein
MAFNINISKFLPPNSSKTNIEKKSDFALLMKVLLEGHHIDITLKAQGGAVKVHCYLLATVSRVRPQYNEPM